MDVGFVLSFTTLLAPFSQEFNVYHLLSLLSIQMLKIAGEVALIRCTCKKILARNRFSEDSLMIKSGDGQ